MSPLRTQHLSPSSVCVFFFASLAHLFFGSLSPVRLLSLLYLLNARVLAVVIFAFSNSTHRCVRIQRLEFSQNRTEFSDPKCIGEQRENGELSRAHTEIRQQHRASSHIFRDRNCKCRNRICIELRLNARMKLHLVRITSNATHVMIGSEISKRGYPAFVRRRV